MVGVRCPVFVGRDAELGALRAHLAAALDGRGGFAMVRGAAGLGKSRLCRELIDDAAAGGPLVTVGRAVPSGASAPYRPLAEAVLRAVRARGVPVGEPDLAPWLPALEPMVPLPGLPPTDHRPPDGSPAVRGEAMLRLLRWLGTGRGLLVVLEDLHWADPDTLDVVEYLADNLGGEAVLCVGTLRGAPPSQASALADRLVSRGSASLTDLEALDDAAVEAIVRATAPDTAVDDLARIRRFAEGVPFLVEELLGAPGVPRSFADTVRARAGLLEPAQADVLIAAALLGRSVDWTLLDAASGQPAAVVALALEAGIGQELLVSEAGEVRFRHALTREALLAGVLPPRRAALAARTLVAVEAAHPELPGPWAGVAAELAVQSGAAHRAGELLAVAGTRALAQGALATAAETLSRAVSLLAAGPARAAARARWVEALALAGRVDEAMAVGAAAIGELTALGETAQRADVAPSPRPGCGRRHQVAGSGRACRPRPGCFSMTRPCRAGVPAPRSSRPKRGTRPTTSRVPSGWPRRSSRTPTPRRRHAARHASCSAAACGWATCRGHGQRSSAGSPSPTRRGSACGGSVRCTSWPRIELLDEAGTGRLLEARRSAEALGALSTAATLDLQLAALSHLRFELDEGAHYARDTLALSERLGLDRTRVMALWFLAENHALRRERGESERLLALTQAAAPGDAEVDGMVWAGARAMTALLDSDRAGAFDALAKGMAILPRQPQSPGTTAACGRCCWPPRMTRGPRPRWPRPGHLGIDVNRINRGLLGTAEAILCGRRGGPAATALASSARHDMARYPVWRELALLFAAEAAHRDGWGDPGGWLAVGRRRVHAARARRARGAVPASRAARERWAGLAHHVPRGRGARPGRRRPGQQGDRGPALRCRSAPWKSTWRACCARPDARRAPSSPRWYVADRPRYVADRPCQLRGFTDVCRRPRSPDPD